MVGLIIITEDTKNELAQRREVLIINVVEDFTGSVVLLSK